MKTIDGKHFAITGRFHSMRREDAINALLKRGGIVQNMVSNQTDYLIVGSFRVDLFKQEYLSRKRKTAERLISEGIPIQLLSEEQFLQLLEECMEE